VSSHYLCFSVSAVQALEGSSCAISIIARTASSAGSRQVSYIQAERGVDGGYSGDIERESTCSCRTMSGCGGRPRLAVVIVVRASCRLLYWGERVSSPRLLMNQDGVSVVVAAVVLMVTMTLDARRTYVCSPTEGS
jgi:hypothetical protein